MQKCQVSAPTTSARVMEVGSFVEEVIDDSAEVTAGLIGLSNDRTVASGSETIRGAREETVEGLSASPARKRTRVGESSDPVFENPVSLELHRKR